MMLLLLVLEVCLAVSPAASLEACLVEYPPKCLEVCLMGCADRAE